jgi:thiamine transport system substrate-binding protein
MRHALVTLCTCAAIPVAAQDAPVLRVLTYDSFATEWGPGAAIEAGFEAICGCDLRFVTAGDGAALLARLRLDQGAGADVVLGLDTALTAAATETGLFAEHGVTRRFDLPVAWEDPLFLPYDWGAFAFVYDSGRVTDPPGSFAELAASELSVIVQDPRSSTPGLGLVLWVDHVFGDGAEAMWNGLAPRILTVTPGWSEAYGLFVEGEADMVLSYLTSPAYHAIVEGDDSIRAARFDDGHYIQVEVMGRLARSDQPELAQAFLDYMVGPEAQSILPTTNWMYPAAMPDGGLPPEFPAPPTAEGARWYTPEQAQARRGPAIETWRGALSR